MFGVTGRMKVKTSEEVTEIQWPNFSQEHKIQIGMYLEIR